MMDLMPIDGVETGSSEKEVEEIGNLKAYFGRTSAWVIDG